MHNPATFFDTVFADPPPEAVVVAFSGGMDSTVLLHALARQPLIRAQGLRAIHVDHRLSSDSAGWARRCRDVCHSLAVRIDVVTATVTREGDGPEAAARRARWRAFTQLVGANEVAALAHHRDDQAETFLLRMMRGAGPAGLAAMRTFSTRNNGLRVWRPLLGVGRSDLKAWADSIGLSWIEDPSNADLAFDRNHLRHVVLPMLRARWPATDAILQQATERQADAHALERDAAAALLALAMSPDARSVRLGPLRDAPRHARWAALRDWLSRNGAHDVGAARLRRIDAELIDAGDDAEPRIELGDCILRRYRDAAYALQRGDDDAAHYRLDWTGCEPLVLPGGIGAVSIEPALPMPLPMVVGTREGGERLSLHGDGTRRELKHLLQEAGVPPWQRTRWPVIRLDGDVVAFADIVVGKAMQACLSPYGARLRFDPH